jgi:hypothetical protein
LGKGRLFRGLNGVALQFELVADRQIFAVNFVLQRQVGEFDLKLLLGSWLVRYLKLLIWLDAVNTRVPEVVLEDVRVGYGPDEFVLRFHQVSGLHWHYRLFGL